jgi:outer membrane murein-binding lipoprotein Lpp
VSKTTILLAAVLLVLLIAGCTSTDMILGGDEQVTEDDVDTAFVDFESTLINESDDVEIGSLL